MGFEIIFWLIVIVGILCILYLLFWKKVLEKRGESDVRVRTFPSWILILCVVSLLLFLFLVRYVVRSLGDSSEPSEHVEVTINYSELELKYPLHVTINPGAEYRIDIPPGRNIGNPYYPGLKIFRPTVGYYTDLRRNPCSGNCKNDYIKLRNHTSKAIEFRYRWKYK